MLSPVPTIRHSYEVPDWFCISRYGSQKLVRTLYWIAGTVRQRVDLFVVVVVVVVVVCMYILSLRRLNILEVVYI